MKCTDSGFRGWFVTVIFVVLTLLVSSSGWAASISGTLTNNSGKTGRAYIMLKDQYGYSTGLGTSIAITGPGSTTFTLYGIPAGQYQLSGYLDVRADVPLARGHIFSGCPLFGNTSLIDTTSGDVSSLNYPISAAPAQSVVTPGYINAFSMDYGLFVIFETPSNASEIEIAESYNIYWSTSPNPSATQQVGGGQILGIPSIGDGHQGITGLDNTKSYYVAVEAVLGGVKSGLANTGTTPIPATAPTGGYTLSGTVNFSGITPATPLIVVAYSNGGVYVTRIASPSVSQAYTIQGVQAGTYTIGAFLDQNNSSRIDAGDLKTGFDDNMPTTVAADMTLPDMTLVNQYVYSRLTTRHTNFGMGDAYYLTFNFMDGAKRPTHIDIIGGPNMGLTSMGPDQWGEFDLSYPVPKPIVGDSYNATVYFTDGTNAAVSGLTVTGRVDVLPVMTYPMGQTGPDGVIPRFAWYLTGLPAGDYRQNLQLYNQDGEDWRRSVPITQTSYQYDEPDLTTGNYYSGDIEISDPFGNVSQSYFQFQPTGNSLAVSGVSPSALACGSTTAITISGTGFSAVPADNLVFFNNNSTPAVVNSATSTELTVTLPSCTTAGVPNAATGPVKVTRNISGDNVSAALKGNFTPQVFYDYFVKDSSNVALSGATVNVEGTAISTTTDGTGHYHLPGIPSGIPFQLQIALSGKLPTYSGRMLLIDNYTDTNGNYTLFTPDEVADWGVTSGKGAIRSRVVDYSGINMPGAIVTAYSTLHNSSSYYNVVYTSGAATQSDGRFTVLNVDEGDTVVVTATKSGITFNKRTFVTHGDAVSQGRLTGVPTVSVSGMSPSTAPTGSTIIINGNNFNTEPGQNTICFQNRIAGTNCTIATAATATLLTVQVPCSTGTGPVTVTSNGQTVGAGTLTVPAPVISGFSPANGPTGLPVTITGTGFSSGTCSWESGVNFAGMYNPGIASYSPTQIVFYTPGVSSTTTGTISVSTPSGTATSSGSYTAYPLPFVSSVFTPSVAAPGEAVSVSGTFYDFNTANYGVTIGGIPAAVTSVSASSLVFTVPANAGSGGPVIGSYYDVPYSGPTLTVIYRLSATITGEGTLNSTNGLGDLTCGASSCSANFYYNELASLAATPSAGYNFAGWSGDCGGTGNCVMNMTANKSVDATFTVQPNIKIGANYYGTVQEAFDAAATGNELWSQALEFVEAVILRNSSAVNIRMYGGYTPAFAPSSGFSTVRGSLKVKSPNILHVRQLKVKP
jgi:hypothetical protein